MKLKIKVGDQVQVIAGSEKGKKGAVLELLKEKQKIRIKDIKMQTHFDKEKGIQKKEGFIDYSNVKLLQASAPKQYKKGSNTKKTGLLKR